MRYLIWRLLHPLEWWRDKWETAYLEGFHDGWEAGRVSGIADTEQYYQEAIPRNGVPFLESSDDDLPVHQEVGDL